MEPTDPLVLLGVGFVTSASALAACAAPARTTEVNPVDVLPAL